MSVHTLGVSGQCDVIEYHADPNGIQLPKTDGPWQPYPIEYKRGRPKESSEDRLQLCGQAMCLEEMLCCDIPEGALYYGDIHRREKVVFTRSLRQQVKENIAEMHELFRRGYTPIVKPTKACNACSLKQFCLPKLLKRQSAKAYLHSAMEESG